MENQQIKKAIVITSIFEPTQAVRQFSKLRDHKLIVVGDLKSPEDWKCDSTQFLPVSLQKDLGFSLTDFLPYNHYCRKMLGYLVAMKSNVDFIIDTDDDNIPKIDWSFPAFEGVFDQIESNKGFVNIYELFTNKKVWPRGLPLNLINKNFNLEKSLSSTTCKIGIWQGLADEDPDVDAIYRLTDDSEVYFYERSPVVMGKGTICPFNSQNTIVKRELFPLLYLPTFVTFRFTDILRGLVAQPIMWLYDYQLGFTNASVVQKRNPHDYFKDFISEIPMYQYTEKIIEVIDKVISSNDSISINLHKAYKALLDEKIVEIRELKTLEAWLSDLEKN
jgi:hypothetical protein